MAKQATKQNPATATKAAPIQAARNGTITLAHAHAKAAKLQGKALPPQVSRYATGAVITVTDKTCGGHFARGARLAAWQALLASKTVGDYLQSGHKVKYLAVWATGTASQPAVIRIATK